MRLKRLIDRPRLQETVAAACAERSWAERARCAAAARTPAIPRRLHTDRTLITLTHIRTICGHILLLKLLIRTLILFKVFSAYKTLYFSPTTGSVKGLLPTTNSVRILIQKCAYASLLAP